MEQAEADVPLDRSPTHHWRSLMCWLLERSLTRQPLEELDPPQERSPTRPPLEEVEADVPLEEPDPPLEPDSLLQI
jgi:hypothetical protein